MQRSAAKSRMILERLALLLRSPFLPVQEVIAREVDCDQPFISRAANGRLIRITDRVTDLRRYVIMRVRAERLLKSATSAVHEGRGGDAAKKAALFEGSDRFAGDGRANQGISCDYAIEAVSDLQMYLADGYDARLIVEQIAVLRRAQRVRRPGVSPSSQRQADAELAR